MRKSIVYTHARISGTRFSIFGTNSISLRKKVYVAKVIEQSRDETENCSQTRLLEKHDSKFLYSWRCEQDEQREEEVSQKRYETNGPTFRRLSLSLLDLPMFLARSNASSTSAAYVRRSS